MFSFVSSALANSGEEVSLYDNLAGILPIFAAFFAIYFILLRPQAKKQREHIEMVKNLKVGDKVIISNSLIGKICYLNEEENLAKVEIQKDVIVEVLKNTITNLFDKPVSSVVNIKNDKNK